MTSKALSAELVDTYQQTTRQLTNLLKITAQNGTVLGLTSAEESITYDDGAGDVEYSAIIGMDTYAFVSTSDMSVDNSEADMLLADSGMFSDEQISAGALDYGEYVVYRINRADHSEGHEILDAGTIGIVKNVDGVSGVIELRSLQQLAKQTYSEVDSLTCRAEFGSGGGGTCVYRGECGFNAEALWQSHSVASVGTETDRIFTANSTPSVSGPNGALSFAPGLVLWLTGNNAGKTSEVEAIDGAEITLRFGTPYTIEASDTFKIRPDCDKTWETCRDDYDNQDNFRGEPKIPLTDESAQATPGTAPPSSPVPPAPDDPPVEPDPPPTPPDPPPASTEIVNPGFESGSLSWAGAEWRVNGKRPRSGSRSAEFTGEDLEIPLNNTTKGDVTPSQSVIASCYIASTKPGVMGGRCMLTWYDSENNWLSESYGSTVNSGSFTKSTVSASAPGSAAFVAVGVQPQNPDNLKAIYVDDFEWNL